ncbi:AIPR family protein [Candidatus Methylospira mobilis]|uniref:AIPR family protein n=1 Tax=Candidatus Methylospira mobilis TaxID=1808979 RepID=UPI0028E9EC6B|nr:AIPR family protein [Candidatus Methylospira mobilis]WNV05981.1 AIPR family protein [Candidatus Methylospira mobilis]
MGHEGGKVNGAIKDTIITNDANEFALFNNGIAMLSDETYINERIGQKRKAQLIVKNPQIINGDQTSYMLQ